MAIGDVNPTKPTQEVESKEISLGGVTKPTSSSGNSPSIGGDVTVSK